MGEGQEFGDDLQSPGKVVQGEDDAGEEEHG